MTYAKIDKPCEKVDKAYAKLYKPCEKGDKAYAKIDKTCAPVKQALNENKKAK